MRRQLAVCILDGKILLMIAHHRHQHFFRQFQKLRIKISKNDRRKLGEVYHRFQQSLVFAPARPRNLAGRRIQRLADLLFPLRTA